MLEVKNINLAYDSKKIISNLSFNIALGQNTLLTGASGSGKSSLLNIISGIIKPTSGEVIFENTQVTKLSEAALDNYRKENIGIIFQNFHLINSLTVLENILLAQKLSTNKIDKNYTENILKELGLANEINKLPNKISVGQQQRAAIVRAIINKPKLILADEPTSSLDNQNAQTTIDLLLKISKDFGSTLIVATHDDRIKNNFSNIINLS
jgi:ABC-type lipoprotein export system ATPase subunit